MNLEEERETTYLSKEGDHLQSWPLFQQEVLHFENPTMNSDWRVSAAYDHPDARFLVSGEDLEF